MEQKEHNLSQIPLICEMLRQISAKHGIFFCHNIDARQERRCGRDASHLGVTVLLPIWRFASQGRRVTTVAPSPGLLSLLLRNILLQVVHLCREKRERRDQAGEVQICSALLHRWLCDFCVLPLLQQVFACVGMLACPRWVLEACCVCRRIWQCDSVSVHPGAVVACWLLLSVLSYRRDSTGTRCALDGCCCLLTCSIPVGAQCPLWTVWYVEQPIRKKMRFV